LVSKIGIKNWYQKLVSKIGQKIGQKYFSIKIFYEKCFQSQHQTYIWQQKYFSLKIVIK